MKTTSFHKKFFSFTARVDGFLLLNVNLREIHCINSLFLVTYRCLEEGGLRDTGDHFGDHMGIVLMEIVKMVFPKPVYSHVHS